MSRQMSNLSGSQQVHERTLFITNITTFVCNLMKRRHVGMKSNRFSSGDVERRGVETQMKSHILCCFLLTWLNIINSLWGERMSLVVSALNVKPHSNTCAHSHTHRQDHLTGHVNTHNYTHTHSHSSCWLSHSFSCQCTCPPLSPHSTTTQEVKGWPISTRSFILFGLCADVTECNGNILHV